MVFELPKLPYEYNALEPYIDEQTMRIHHTKHHQAYIDKLNAALAADKGLGAKKMPFDMNSIDEILKHLNAFTGPTRIAVQNHGGGHSNHSFFWKVMASKAGGTPTGKIAEAIEKQFGSFEDFKKKFSETAIGHFGSGWAWLALNARKLEIFSLPNQDSPLLQGKIPILGIDLWEHSFYLKWQNRKADYVNSWWNVVNWKRVEENYQNAQEK